MAKPPILFVTGLSGAGISSALKALEDNSYEVFDNFPPGHIPALLEEDNEGRAIAFGLDTRTRAFDPQTIIALAQDLDARILFLTASDNCLQKRFSETRRLHPSAKHGTVADGIAYERDWLTPLNAKADYRIDSTDLTVHDFKHIVQSQAQSVENTDRLNVTLMSFGFKNGIPREADIVMDVRFLKNPHWEEKLRPLTGKDTSVGAYIETDEEFSQFIANFQSMLKPLLPRYTKEGKTYLTIAIGCTGGRHRSVFTAETIKSWLSEQNVISHIRHRDLED